MLKTVHHVEKLENSVNGNPRFKFVFRDGNGSLETMKTEPDCGWVFGISPGAIVGRAVVATFHYGPDGDAILDGIVSGGDSIKALGANKTEVKAPGGVVVFYSYDTPVAARLPGGECVRTSTKWSSTTSKHINQWLAGAPAREVPQGALNALEGGEV